MRSFTGPTPTCGVISSSFAERADIFFAIGRDPSTAVILPVTFDEAGALSIEHGPQEDHMSVSLKVGTALAAAAAVGCGGGTPSGSSSAVTHSLYVVHAATTSEPEHLSGYQIDAARGTLTAVPGSPYTFTGDEEVNDIAVSPSNRYVYVTVRIKEPIGGTGTRLRVRLQAFARDAGTGALSAIPDAMPDSAVSSCCIYRSPVFDPSGRFLYVGDPGAEFIIGFRFDETTGHLGALDGRQAFAAANNLDGLVVAPGARFLYATAGLAVVLGDSRRGFVLSYAIDDKGALTPVGDRLPAGEYTRRPVIHPSGRFLYAPNTWTNDISGYSVDPQSGALAALPRSPFAAGVVEPQAVALTPSGRYLYAAGAQDRSVSSFSVDAATGALQPIGPAVATGTSGRGGLIIEPSGRFLYVAGLDSGLWAYSIEADTGRLTPMAGSPNATLPRPSVLATTHQVANP
jgi:6-phosphogluconolactonase (cycloisomerase 2 family)